ncbi:MAG: hypothetical protein WC087_03925 [Candidatus Paceibacterota bacterium]
MRGMETLDREIDERKETIELLESLDGYAKLSEKQKQIIRTFLYLEDRSNREDANVDYQKSLAHKDAWYCHAAVVSVELERVVDELAIYPENIHRAIENETKFDSHFMKADYIDSDKTQQEVEDFIEEVGFPCTVVFSWFDGLEFDMLAHSCIALGKDETGRLIVWEKKNAREACRVINFGEVYDFYEQGLKDHNKAFPQKGYYGHWGVRKIETGGSL